MIATLRLVSASTKQLIRSREVMATMLVYPAALLGVLAIFSKLRLETTEGATSLMDFWVTGAGVLVVALGNGHAFLATIATYKATGVLKRISITPISPAQLILAEVVPRAAMGMVTIVAFLAVGRALGADIRLELGVLGVAAVMVMVTATGLSVAFVIAGLTKTPQDANALDSYVSFPLYLFTGAMFPLAAFPAWLEQIAQFIPYAGLIATVRGIAIHGQPLSDFGPELAIGAGWLALLFLAAARAYSFVK
jgi:ABC-2 type transport system permease protein